MMPAALCLRLQDREAQDQSQAQETGTRPREHHADDPERDHEQTELPLATLVPSNTFMKRKGTNMFRIMAR